MGHQKRPHWPLGASVCWSSDRHSKSTSCFLSVTSLGRSWRTWTTWPSWEITWTTSSSSSLRTSSGVTSALTGNASHRKSSADVCGRLSQTRWEAASGSERRSSLRGEDPPTPTPPAHAAVWSQSAVVSVHDAPNSTQIIIDSRVHQTEAVCLTASERRTEKPSFLRSSVRPSPTWRRKVSSSRSNVLIINTHKNTDNRSIQSQKEVYYRNKEMTQLVN